MTMKVPALLQEFTTRPGWLVSSWPWYAYRVISLYRTSVIIRLVPGREITDIDNPQNWTLMIVDSKGGELHQHGGNRAQCLRRADTAAYELNTVVELRNLRHDRIREALDSLSLWALEVARRDLEVPATSGTEKLIDAIVDRLVTPQTA